jgi:uncharacterized protein (DUF2249 family)
MARELDPLMRQVLVVVQNLTLPCADGDVLEVVHDVAPADIRAALQRLGEDHLDVTPHESGGELVRVEVNGVRQRID